MKYFKLFEEFLSEKDKPENEEDKSKEATGADTDVPDEDELDAIDAEIDKTGEDSEETEDVEDKEKKQEEPKEEKKVSAIVKQYGIQEIVDNPDKFEGDYFKWPNIQNVFARMNKSIKPLSTSDIARDGNISTAEKAFSKLYSKSGPLENMIVVPLKGNLTSKADELKNKLRNSITKLEFTSSDVTDYSKYQFWNGTEFVTLDAATTNVKFYKYTDNEANTFIIRYAPKGENIGMESATAYYGPSDLFDEK